MFWLHFNSEVNQNVKGHGFLGVVNMMDICALGPRWQYRILVKCLGSAVKLQLHLHNGYVSF